MPARNPILEIDLAALCANYRAMAAAVPRARPAAVVKCDAYGLGAAAVATALKEKENCRSFFVAYPEEGAELRSAIGGDADIYVFNGPFDETLAAYRAFALTPVLNSLEQAALWAREMPGKPAAAHFDTGMHRLGLSLADFDRVRAIGGLNIAVIMSHLACASDPKNPMNARQLAAFSAAAAQFPAAQKSLSSSGGALIGEDFGFDLVRLGVGLYGVNPHDSGPSPARPVARLTAPVIQVHAMSAGETVGYGATFSATRRSVLATVALGYGDGFPRSGSNQASALLGGILCPVAGRVSMDLIVLDATDAERTPKIGDEAEFFGPGLSIDGAAASCGTIGYELLTNIGGLARPRAAVNGAGLGGRLQRRYLWNGAPAGEALARAEGN
ncbi:MAG: alanine racemase [Pseudomonadota bacterium]